MLNYCHTDEGLWVEESGKEDREVGEGIGGWGKSLQFQPLPMRVGCITPGCQFTSASGDWFSPEMFSLGTQYLSSEGIIWIMLVALRFIRFVLPEGKSLPIPVDCSCLFQYFCGLWYLLEKLAHIVTQPAFVPTFWWGTWGLLLNLRVPAVWSVHSSILFILSGKSAMGLAQYCNVYSEASPRVHTVFPEAGYQVEWSYKDDPQEPLLGWSSEQTFMYAGGYSGLSIETSCLQATHALMGVVA